MKEYIEKKAAEIQDLHTEYQKEIKNIRDSYNKKWVAIYGEVTKANASQKAAFDLIEQDEINKCKQDFLNNLEAKNQECLNHIAAERKKLHQGIVNAEPIPTSEQVIVTEQLVKQYHNMVNSEKFFADMQFHIENETAKALPYYFASKEMFPDDLQVDVVLRTLVPAIAEMENKLLEIDEMERIYKVFYINFQLSNTVTDNMQSIRLKRELEDVKQRMKEYEQKKAAIYNQPRISQIIDTLNRPGLSNIEVIALKQELAGLGGMAQLNQSVRYAGR